MKKYDLAMSGILILLGAGILYLSSGYGDAVAGTAIGSGVWPSILAVVLIVLAIVQGIQAILKKGTAEEEPFSFRSSGMIRVYIFLGIIAVYAAILKLFGFYPSAALLGVGLMLLMGERRIWMLAAVAAGMLLFIWLVFGMALGLHLPHGIVF